MRSRDDPPVIPERMEDLDAVLAEIERQHHEAADLFEGVSTEAATWRPDRTRWSMTGHLAHLGIVNDAYLATIEEAVAREPDGGPPAEGPYRHPWIAKQFVRLLEPPPRRRVKTFRSMTPGADPDPGEALATFQGQLADLRDLVERSRGLDLGKVRFGSPFARLLRLSLGSSFDIVLAHNRRHLWLIRELMSGEGFPG